MPRSAQAGDRSALGRGRRRTVCRISQARGALLGASLRRVPSMARRVAEAALAALPSLRGTPLKGRLRLAKKMARSASLDPVDRFIANCTYLDAEQKSGLYTSAMVSGSFRRPILPAEHRAAIRPRPRRRLPAPDALSRHQDFHDQPEPHLQRQDEHGVVGRSAGSISRPRAGRICGVEYSARE